MSRDIYEKCRREGDRLVVDWCNQHAIGVQSEGVVTRYFLDDGSKIDVHNGRVLRNEDALVRVGSEILHCSPSCVSSWEHVSRRPEMIELVRAYLERKGSTPIRIPIKNGTIEVYAKGRIQIHPDRVSLTGLTEEEIVEMGNFLFKTGGNYDRK